MARIKMQVTTRFRGATDTGHAYINVRWEGRSRRVNIDYALDTLDKHKAAVLDVFPRVDFDRSEEVGATGYRFWISWNNNLEGVFSS